MIPLNMNMNMNISAPPNPNPIRSIMHHHHLPFSLSGSSHFLASSSSLSIPNPNPKSRGRVLLLCRAELHRDAAFSIAIGASIFNTLLFTHPAAESSDDDDAPAVSSTDARFAVMTLISFIPYFNWLSWVFALMDTGKQRYAVYALVYLAPYLRTNLSLSPDESWLPIASIALCIFHIQLEASIKSGDLESFYFFNEIGKRLGFINLKKDAQPPKSLSKRHPQETRQNIANLPLGQQRQSRDEMRNRRVPRKPSEDVERVVEDDGTKH